MNENPLSTKENTGVYDDGKYALIDLGSLNGTYINGARIPVKSVVPISVGDIIGIANLEFVVEAV